MPVDAFHVGPVASENAFFVVGEKIPNPDSSVVGTRCKFLEKQVKDAIMSYANLMNFYGKQKVNPSVNELTMDTPFGAYS